MNHIVIKGRLTRDPELRQTPTNVSVCAISVAVDRPFGKNNEVDFFNCVAWRQTAEFVSKYFSKGQEILLSGSMQSRNYEDKDGNNRTIWELQADHVEFCGNKAQNGGNDAAPSRGGKPQKPQSPAPALGLDDDDGNLPF